MDKDNLMLLERVARVEKRLKNKATACLCPGCSSPSIRSHSQQKSGSLSRIAENGHVMGVSRHIAASVYDATPESVPLPRIDYIGVREASTFWGYCNRHDTELFDCLETKPLQKDDIKQVFALHLRAMSFERMAKLNHREILTVLPPYQTEVIVHENLFAADTRYRWDLLWCDDKLAKFQKSYSYQWVVIPEELGVSAVAMIPPLTAVREDRYMTAHRHKDGSYDVARPSFSLSVVPVQSMTHVVMCWHRDDADYVAPWKNDLCSGDNARLASFLNRCIFAKSEDYYIRPSLWNSLSSSVQKLVKFNLCCNDIGLDVPEVIVLNNKRHIG